MRTRNAVAIAVGLSLVLASWFWAAASVPVLTTFTGQLGAITRDDPATGSSVTRFTLYVNGYAPIPLDIADSVLAAGGGFMQTVGQTVDVAIEKLPVPGEAARVYDLGLAGDSVRWFNVDPGPAQEWINLPCKFSDVADEPPISQIEDFYSSAPNHVADALTHLSHGFHTFSSTTRPWATLPHPKAYYQTHNLLEDDFFRDCRDAHGLPAGVPNVNLLFNADAFNGSAAGGIMFENGTMIRVTWLPPWAWQRIATAVHEIGHAYGLPHSNNDDGDTNPYDNPWDVMSDSATGAINLGGTLNAAAKPTNSYHAYKLGWIPAPNVAVVTTVGTQTVTIDHWGPNSSSNAFVALIPLDYPDPNRATSLYAVEVRRGIGDAGNGQANLPDGDGVLIYQISTQRRDPAWLIGAASGELVPVMDVGESYHDAANGVTITVLAATADGYSVQISRGGVPATPVPTMIAPLAQQGDLRVTLTELSDPVIAGDRARYQVVVDNPGTTTVVGARLTVQYPEAAYEHPVDVDYLWTNITGQVIWNGNYIDNGIAVDLETIPPTGSLRVELDLYSLAGESGVWTIHAAVNHALTELTPGNNQAAASTLILAAADVEPSGTQLLVNGQFDVNTRDLSGWRITRPSGAYANDKLVCDKPAIGKFVSRSAPCAFRYIGGTGENTALKQTIFYSGPALLPDQALVIKAWVRAAKLPPGTAKLKAVVSYAGTADKDVITLPVTVSSTSGAYVLMTSKALWLPRADLKAIKLSVIFRAQATNAKLWVDDLGVLLLP